MSKNLPSHLPRLKAGWSWVKLGDVGISIKGKKPKRQSNVKDSTFSIPYVDIKAFENRGIDNFTDGVNCIFCEPDDVLIVWDGARCGLVGRGIRGAIGSTLAKIKSQMHINSFLFYFLQMNYKLINSNPKGVGIPHIEPNLFWNLTIPLPPLSEQKKIVEKIEELFSQLDSGVAALKKAKEQIRLYRQSVLAAAFSGRLNQDLSDSRIKKIDKKNKSGKLKNPLNPNSENLNPVNPTIPVNHGSDNLPNGWKWVKLGEVCNKIGDVDHKMPKPVENGKYPYLSTKDFTDDLKIDFKKAKLISEEDYTLLSKKIKPQKGDIIFPRYGTIGKNVLVDCDKEFLVSYSCAVIKPNTEKIVTKYLYHYSLSPLIKKEIKKYTVQTTQANVGIESIKSFIVPLPSIIQQTQIVSEIEKRFSEADNLEKAIDESLVKTETLRQSILSQAFSGKLL